MRLTSENRATILPTGSLVGPLRRQVLVFGPIQVRVFNHDQEGEPDLSHPWISLLWCSFSHYYSLFSENLEPCFPKL